MPNGVIPERIDPRRLARESAVLEGVLPTAGMRRLASAVLALGTSARLQARVGVDEQGRPLLEGAAGVEVTLRCQRCLEPMVTELHAPFRLAVVVSDADARRLPDELDALIVEDERIDTAALVEDELILALPVVGRHEDMQACRVGPQHMESAPAEGESTADEEDAPGPFAALEALKRDRDD